MAGVVHGGAWRIVDLVDWKEGEAKVGFSVRSEEHTSELQSR